MSFRSLVVPREHGSWSLALEPVALGLLVAPSRAGGWLALAVVAGFFTRRPLKLAATLPAEDPRQHAAGRWTLMLAALALVGLGLATVSGEARALWPLLLAAPLGAAFLWFDLRGEMREAEAELAGSAAFAFVPAAFATLAGWGPHPALALAALALARAIPTVLTVRTYLRFAKGKPAAALPAIAAALAAFAGVAALTAFQLVPVAACALAGLLAARTAWMLSPFATAWSAKRVGLMEAVLGVLYVGVLALTFTRR